MTSRKGQPGPFDGMERAQPGEPVFTLRAHDPLAARFVKAWVWMRRKAIRRAHAAGEIKDEKRDLELVQCREAEEIGFAMDEWRQGIADEVPAEDETVSKSYVGNQPDERQLEAERLWQARKAMDRQLQNAISEISDAAEVLSEWGFDIGRAMAAEGVAKLQEASVAISPSGGYSVADLDKEWP